MRPRSHIDQGRETGSRKSVGFRMQAFTIGNECDHGSSSRRSGMSMIHSAR